MESVSTRIFNSVSLYLPSGTISSKYIVSTLRVHARTQNARKCIVSYRSVHALPVAIFVSLFFFLSLFHSLVHALSAFGRSPSASSLFSSPYLRTIAVRLAADVAIPLIIPSAPTRHSNPRTPS